MRTQFSVQTGGQCLRSLLESNTSQAGRSAIAARVRTNGVMRSRCAADLRGRRPPHDKGTTMRIPDPLRAAHHAPHRDHEAARTPRITSGPRRTAKSHLSTSSVRSATGLAPTKYHWLQMSRLPGPDGFIDLPVTRPLSHQVRASKAPDSRRLGLRVTSATDRACGAGGGTACHATARPESTPCSRT